MGNFKGSNTTTQTSTSAADPQAAALYRQLLGQAQGVAATPYTPYTGQMVAGFSPDQQSAFNTVNQTQGISQPYIDQATNYANVGAAPITAADLQRYQNPYQQQVVNATLGNIQANNATQRASLTGDAIAKGAYGGDRAGIAQNDLARQQDLATNQTLAGLESQGFTTSLGAAQADRAAAGQGAYTFGNLGQLAQALPLQGAAAQLQTGNLEQQLAQANLNVPYNNYQEARAYPFQTLSWEAGLGTGVGSQLGGTTNGATTAPAPNPLNSILGAGLSAAAMFAHRGGRVHRAGGGGLSMPYSGGFIPLVPISPGGGPPKLPSAPSQSKPADNGLGSMVNNALGAASKLKSHFNSPGSPLDLGGGFTPSGVGTTFDIGSAPAVSGLGALFRRGGGVSSRQPNGIYLPRHFDDGGEVTPNDRVGASFGDLPPAGFVDPGNYNALQDYGSALGFDDDTGPSVGHLADVPLPGERPIARAGADHDDGLAAIDRAAPLAARGEPDDGMAMAFDAGPRGNAPIAATAPSAPQADRGGLLSRLGVNLSPEMRHALLATGLGMMASRSPNAGVAIGEGGLRGLSQYGEEQKTTREAAKTKSDQDYRQQTLTQGSRRIDLEAQRLQQAADQAAKVLAETSKQHAESERHNRTAEEEIAAQHKFEHEKYEVPAGFRRTQEGGLEAVPGGPHDPATLKAETEAKNGSGMSDAAIEIGARQLVAGDLSGLTNLGRGRQGDQKITALRNKAAQILVDEYGFTTADAAAHLGAKLQGFRASGIGQSAEARTAATREANLNLILKATDAAIPAALEAGQKVWGMGTFVPLNRLIQNGLVMTSNPELREFGMANLQLAEHWARAMNPTGVMRESDRDLALHFLDTAVSPDTYKRAVAQLQKQITRERDAVRSTREGAATPTAPAPRAAAPAPTPSKDPLGEARAAIAGGAPRDAVVERLRQSGVDPAGL